MRKLLLALSISLLSLATASAVAAAPVTAAAPMAAAAPAPAAEVASTRLETEIAHRLDQVEAFHYIREEAEKLGVRVWLFGGTAAGFGHYVRWDLEREAGNPRYQKDRFDYHYSNIYRSTQDADLVVDGTPEQARQLQKLLAEKFPFLQGSKSTWEVRLLRAPVGDKDALLDNPNFLDQHTDSNSTGMIELTRPPAGEGAVRDLREWESREPFFLRDLTEGRLHYYFSDKHPETLRFRLGLNPPILSVIRYLTKAFQYELGLRPEDLEQIRKVISEFDPKRDLIHPYVATWVEKNGPKLFKNAVNIEYAAQVLDDLGLRAALMKLGDPSKYDSLAWWLNRMPLASHPVGEPQSASIRPGRTAAELGITEVAHETRSFAAYESITLAHTGDPNVFISRKGGFTGEAAVHGDGFYTRKGHKGAAHTGLTIRFDVDPQAREGVDFFVAGGDYVVFRNKAALRVRPETLNFGLVEYFEWLADPEKGFDHSDRGIAEKMRQRLRTSSQPLAEAELTRIRAVVQHAIANSSDDTMIKEWERLVAPRGHALFASPLELFHWTSRNRLLSLHAHAVLREPLVESVSAAAKLPPEELREAFRTALESFAEGKGMSNSIGGLLHDASVLPVIEKEFLDWSEKATSGQIHPLLNTEIMSGFQWQTHQVADPATQRLRRKIWRNLALKTIREGLPSETVPLFQRLFNLQEGWEMSDLLYMAIDKADTMGLIEFVKDLKHARPSEKPGATDLETAMIRAIEREDGFPKSGGGPRHQITNQIAAYLIDKPRPLEDSQVIQRLLKIKDQQLGELFIKNFSIEGVNEKTAPLLATLLANNPSLETTFIERALLKLKNEELQKKYVAHYVENGSPEARLALVQHFLGSSHPSMYRAEINSLIRSASDDPILVALINYCLISKPSDEWTEEYLRILAKGYINSADAVAKALELARLRPHARPGEVAEMIAAARIPNRRERQERVMLIQGRRRHAARTQIQPLAGGDACAGTYRGLPGRLR